MELQVFLGPFYDTLAATTRARPRRVVENAKVDGWNKTPTVSELRHWA
jgi:hypothetical protein